MAADSAKSDSQKPEWARMGTEDILELLLHLDEIGYLATQRGIYRTMKNKSEMASPSRQTVMRVLNSMEERGYVKVHKKKRYSLTDSGREMAEDYPLQTSSE